MIDTKKYAGKQFYALVSRMGGKFRTIYALAIYEIKENGVPKKIAQGMNLVANKSQFECMNEITKESGYVLGRPSLKRMQQLTEEQLCKLTS